MESLALEDGSVVSGLLFQSANDGTTLPMLALNDVPVQQVEVSDVEFHDTSLSDVRIRVGESQVISRIDSGGALHEQQQ
eukprot:6599675-Alexandrium_andersonii.AAC.1